MEYGANPYVVGSDNSTPLIEALDSESYDIMELLIKNGADIEYEFYDNTCLVRAVRIGDIQAVKLLLEYGANPNVTDDGGYTLLEYIESGYIYTYTVEVSNYEEIYRILKHYGAK